MNDNYDYRKTGAFGADDVFDDFEDEKLDRVLDEIAEIKQTIQGLPDAYDDFGSGYDDVTKLRDEVRFSKTTQRLQDEIKRLSNRLNDFRDESNAAGERTESVTLDELGKLVAYCEEIIRSCKEADKKFTDAVAEIKRRLYKLASSADLMNELDAIKAAVKNAEELLAGVGGTVDELHAEVNREAGANANTEILRQFYDIKNLLGNPSPIGERRNDELLDLYNMLASVKNALKSKSVSLADKYVEADKLAKKLYETTESDVRPIADGLNSVIRTLGKTPLDRDGVDSVLDYARNGGDAFSVSASRRETVSSYMDSVETFLSGAIGSNLDDLPDIIALKNNIQNNRNEFECENVYSAVLNTNIALLGEKDLTKQKALRKQLKEQLERLTSLEASDLVDYKPVEINKPYRAHKRGEGEGIFDKLNELKNLILDANLRVGGDAVSQPVSNGIIGEINSLKNEIYNLSNIDNISQSILDLKSDCLTILDKLDERNAESDDMSVIASVPSLSEIVAQLDRLFDDVKNLVADSENNVLSSLEVIGEAVGNLASVNKENAEEAKTDRKKLMDDVAYIRDVLAERKPAEIVPAVTESDIIAPSENGNDELNAKIASLELNQRKIIAMLEKMAEGSVITASLDERLTALEGKVSDTVTKETGALRDQLFAISMASVSDGESNDYESYNNVILGEIYSLQDSLEAIREAVERSGNAENEQLNKELAELKSEISDALGKSGDNEEIIKELNKIKEEFKSKPAPKPKPEPPKATTVQVRKQKKVTPIMTSDPSISELIAKISNTDIVIKED